MKRVSFLLFLFGVFAHAKTIHLFERGRQVGDYDTLLRNVRAGDVLQFQDGNRFEILSEIGAGGTTQIYQVRPLDPRPGEPAEMALRIPKKAGDFPGEGKTRAYADFIDITIQGEPKLRKRGIAIPTFYRSSPGQYVALEYIPYDFDLERLFESPESFSPAVLKRAQDALLEFAKSTVGLEMIGDMKPAQLVYQAKENRWVLLDWCRIYRKFPVPIFQRNHTFGEVFLRNYFNDDALDKYSTRREQLTRFQESLLDKIHKTILAERKKQMPMRACVDEFFRWLVPALNEAVY